MKVTIIVKDSLEKNAQRYFELAKKARKKAEGAKKAISVTKKKVNAVLPIEHVEKKLIAPRKREWFERFHWCVASSGKLLIGGKDATTNEILIKKYAEANDVVCHTDMAGSPFIVIKAEGQEISEQDLEEAAQMTAMYSRAWRNGLATLEVFHVKPEQITKQAKSGESLPKGAFMIRGQTKYLHPRVGGAIGLYKGTIMGGPITAIKKHCDLSVEIRPGKVKTSDAAKRICKRIGGELNDVVAALPAGGIGFLEEKR